MSRSWCSDLGRLDLTITKGKITAHHRTQILLDHDQVPSDPSAAKLVAQLFKALDEVVGRAGGWLVRA